MVGLSRIVADGEPCRLDSLIVPARRFEAVGEAGVAGGCRRVACDGPSTLIRGLLEPVEIPQRHGEAVMDDARPRSNGQGSLVVTDRFSRRILATKCVPQGEIDPEVAGVHPLHPLQKRDRICSGRCRASCECEKERHRLVRDRRVRQRLVNLRLGPPGRRIPGLVVPGGRLVVGEPRHFRRPAPLRGVYVARDPVVERGDQCTFDI